MSFYNPYIDTNAPLSAWGSRSGCGRGGSGGIGRGGGGWGKSRANRPAAPARDMSRLVPICFRHPGRAGVYSVHTRAPPTYFDGGKERQVFPRPGQSLWSERKPAAREMARRLMQPGGQPIELTFHVYDIIETTYTSERCDEVPFRFQTDIIPSGTVLKLLGRTEEGLSVCMNVFGQGLYFYTRAPASCNLQYILQQALNDAGSLGRAGCSFHVTQERKRILKEYDTETHEVHRVHLSSSTQLGALTSQLLTSGCEVFETNVDAARRFVIDRDLTTFGWYRCSAAYPRAAGARDAWTDLEFDCGVGDLDLLRDRTDWPAYTVLSFDIECLGEGGFPSATQDTDLVLQISCVLWSVGAAKETQRHVLLSLGTCDPIPDTEVLEFPSELDMFYAFFSLIRDGNVEFVAGYNIANFDFPYLIDRATQVYSLPLREYCRVRTGAIFEVHKPTGDAGFARSVSKVKVAGVVSVDMYIVCRDKLSLSDYKLNTVAQVCLGAQKDDVSYKEIPGLFRAGPGGRARLGRYCVQDAALVMDLLRLFVTHVEVAEIAKIALIPPRRVLYDGQQIRVYSCLLAAARAENYILPTIATREEQGYQGATVIDPLPGFYDTPVLVVDFASLYPSIIQAHNLCYSTLVSPERLRTLRLREDDYETFQLSGGPVHFVRRHVRESLLARLLTTWLAKRKAIRAEMARCEDPVRRTILDKQQQAIKATCNSVYGFTGVASGLFPCLKIAETVTLRGRTMLSMSKDYIEAMTVDRVRALCPSALEPPHAPAADANFRVVYGDTDSLFIETRGYPMGAVLALSEALVADTTKSLFRAPVKLEAEKVFGCLLLLTKKRYVGTLSDGKLLMKGVDLIRKTACRFVQQNCRKILDLLLQDPEVKRAAHALSAASPTAALERGLPAGFVKIVDVLNECGRELRAGRVPVRDLTFSTELSRPFAAYKNTCLPHLAVYQKILARNEEPPQLHDRIPYVFVGTGGTCGKGKKSEMAEDPAYVEQHHVPVAADLYFDKLVRGVASILQCVFGNDKDHTARVLYNFVNVPYAPLSR
nr:DNA polymerase catalytic subunit [Eptesicus fuscus gammaherpesvirus]